MLWIKALHVIFMVTWFCGLFYLPRLFVYHSLSEDAISRERFKIMERKLYFGITTPGAFLTLLFGYLLIRTQWTLYLSFHWMQYKLGFVFLLVLYHLYLGKLLYRFKQDNNQHTSVFYRWINEIPVLFLCGIIILVIVKPF